MVKRALFRTIVTGVRKRENRGKKLSLTPNTASSWGMTVNEQTVRGKVLREDIKDGGSCWRLARLMRYQGRGMRNLIRCQGGEDSLNWLSKVLVTTRHSKDRVGARLRPSGEGGSEEFQVGLKRASLLGTWALEQEWLDLDSHSVSSWNSCSDLWSLCAC